MYQINQLSFSYETKEVLKNISVTFPTNKITAIIGPNGCGKSTLLSHLYRLHPSKNKEVFHLYFQHFDMESHGNSISFAFH